MRIVHEDARLLVVDKAPGELVIAGRDGTPGLRERLSEERGERLLAVHRLDAGTSGLVVLARDPAAHRALSLAFEGREVEKTYLALVAGVPAWSERRCEAALHEARKGRMRPAHPGEPGAKASCTELAVRERFAGHALVEARPLTGRQHQIRVHLKYEGFSLTVDPLYGRKEPLNVGGAVLDRTPLHAARLSLPHPDGPRVTFEAPLPEDLSAFLAALRVR